YGYRSIINKVDAKKLLPVLLVLYALATLTLYLITVTITPTLTILFIPFCFMSLANGACYPIVVAEALKTFPDNSGKAAAMQNSIQLGVCFLASGLVSLF